VSRHRQAGAENQTEVTDLDLIAVGEHRRVDGLAVDIGAVQAAEINDAECAVFRPELKRLIDLQKYCGCCLHGEAPFSDTGAKAPPPSSSIAMMLLRPSLPTVRSVYMAPLGAPVLPEVYMIIDPPPPGCVGSSVRFLRWVYLCVGVLKLTLYAQLGVEHMRGSGLEQSFLLPDERDVIADFIADVAQYDASPESVARASAKVSRGRPAPVSLNSSMPTSMRLTAKRLPHKLEVSITKR
jgi:hypothetical protein